MNESSSQTVTGLAPGSTKRTVNGDIVGDGIDDGHVACRARSPQSAPRATR